MNSSDPYVKELAQKLEKQNGLKAALLSVLWCLPVLTAWNFVHVNNQSFAPVMFLISGLIIGVAVRLHGKGYTAQFSLIAFVCHIAVCLIALSLNIVVGHSLSVVYLAGLYIAGAFFAIYLAKIEVSMTYNRAYIFLTEKQPHPSFVAWKNKWIVNVPITILCAGTISLYSGNLLFWFNVSAKQIAYEEEQHQLQQRLESRHINIEPNELQKRPVMQSFLYAYAYLTGSLYNKNGYYIEAFPKSTYKAKAILRFLAESKQQPRAMYLLAKLSENPQSLRYRNRAAELGDEFAKLDQTLSIACKSSPSSGRNLIVQLYSLTKLDTVNRLIEEIITEGLEDICQQKNPLPIELSYVIDM